MRVLVTGGRDFRDGEALAKTLRDLDGANKISLLIHGNARGADALADAWAKAHGIETQALAADWRRYGRAAGVLRNNQLLQAEPDLVVAFPGEKGTQDMIAKTIAAGGESANANVVTPPNSSFLPLEILPARASYGVANTTRANIGQEFTMTNSVFMHSECLVARTRPIALDRTIQNSSKSLEEYRTFTHAFAFFNAALFSRRLPECFITLNGRARGSSGYFCAQMFQARTSAGSLHEISLNPHAFVDCSDQQIMQILVHEMCHHWQQEFGKPGRRGYHNRQWAQQMDSIGLIPSTTGAPGGKRTGQRMSDYVAPGGQFEQAVQDLLETGFRLRWQSADRPAHGKRNKVCYRCRNCSLKAWAKPEVSLVCGSCQLEMNANSISKVSQRRLNGNAARSHDVE